MGRSRLQAWEINVKVYHKPVITWAEPTEANPKLLNKPKVFEFLTLKTHPAENEANILKITNLTKSN